MQNMGKNMGKTRKGSATQEWHMVVSRGSPHRRCAPGDDAARRHRRIELAVAAAQEEIAWLDPPTPRPKPPTIRAYLAPAQHWALPLRHNS